MVAVATGKWNAKDLQARGTFEATFLIPEVDGSCSLLYTYAATGECLAFADFSLGMPVIKLNAELVRK